MSEPSTIQETDKFQHPPLEQVALEINFAPKLKIFDILSEFYDDISDHYPAFSVEQTREQANGLDGPSELFKQGWVIANSDETRIVKIAATGFVLIEKKYCNFEAFVSEVDDLWSQFLKYAGDVSLSRIGLRYINRLLIPQKDGGYAAHKYANSYFILDKLQEYEIGTVSTEARIKVDDKHLTIRSRIGDFSKEREMTFLNCVLDYDCYLQHSDIESSMVDVLSELHEVIGRQFRADILPAYAQYMRTGRFENV